MASDLSKAMAVELAPHGSRVNTVARIFTETAPGQQMIADPAFRDLVLGTIPLRTIAQPDDVVAAVLDLASPASRTITGTCLNVDGGWTAH